MISRWHQIPCKSEIDINPDTVLFRENELEKTSTVAKFATVQIEGERKIERQIEYYNLDVIISV